MSLQKGKSAASSLKIRNAYRDAASRWTVPTRKMKKASMVQKAARANAAKRAKNTERIMSKGTLK